MATTNAQQWNPAAINQETDAQYLADSSRAGGFGTDDVWPSPLANKTLYQVSTYVTALANMLANKGYSNSDADLSVLTAVMSNILTEADEVPAIIVVAYSPTPVFNAGTASGFQMTLSGNVTSSTFSSGTPGQLLAFYFAQDSVGGRTVAWPSSFVGAAQPDPAANAVSIQLFRLDLSGVPRACTPMLSNNGVFIGVLSATSATIGTLSLSSGAAVGDTLVFNGTSFVKRSYMLRDMTSSRARDTVYLNDTGSELTISGWLSITPTGGDSSLTVLCSATSSGGSLTGAIFNLFENTQTATGGGAQGGFFACIPAGYYYEVLGYNGLINVGSWVEGYYA